MNIVLHQPEIPHNTGAVGRTCLVTGAQLHLIHPLGFYLDEKSLKRSGLDYWPKLKVAEYDSFQHFLDTHPDAHFYLVETGGTRLYTQVSYTPADFLVFGSETTGLPPWMREEYPHRLISIPMIGRERSLNLSVSVGIVLYEALRQNGFEPKA
ncbi:MAG: tRNA (cytidine(34)-2'-O)-methyltransferase [Defluviitaleaceae bacterium]|nr:tRNA (cytidine(34)-2'-O)-methyltransferase [Defluviitaleaceae bacterium]MCL2238786.1 tRNA (cytidine(34)-2'-O)-methyltransferase [Defluviitaleaceae bacterium]